MCEAAPRRERKERSATAACGAGSRLAGREAHDVRALHARTRAGPTRRLQASVFTPTSTAKTARRPRASRQSVKPPVEQPASRKTRPAAVDAPLVQRRASFSPPRDTYGRPGPQHPPRRHRARAVPGLQDRLPVHAHLAAQDGRGKLAGRDRVRVAGAQQLEQPHARARHVRRRRPAAPFRSARALPVDRVDLQQDALDLARWSSRTSIFRGICVRLRAMAVSLLHADDARDGPRHPDVRDVGGAPGEDPLVGGLHVGVRADHGGCFAVQPQAQRFLLFDRLPRGNR